MKQIGFLFFVVLLSCTPKDKDTHIVTRYPTGELQSEYYKNKRGEANGELKYYYKNGQLKFTVNLKNDLYDGKLTSYYENGALESTEYYTLNKLNGWSIHYDSLGKWMDQMEYVLIYPEMINNKSNHFIEPDSVAIEKKESYVNKRIFYRNDKFIRDSSFYCKLISPEIVKLGDTLFFDLYIAVPFFKSSRQLKGLSKTITKIMNSDQTEVESFDVMKKGFGYSVPYWKKGFFIPQKKGLGYLFGFIIEEKENGEYFEHYFKKSYKVK